MGFLQNLKEKLLPSKQNTNRLFHTKSNKDELNSTIVDSKHQEDYDKPRNRMMDTLSNEQLAEEARGSSLGIDNKNLMTKTLSNTQAAEFANGASTDAIMSNEKNFDVGPLGATKRKNEMIDTKPNDEENLRASATPVPEEPLNSDRVL
ncbi:hypothetical protein DAMA08_040180 [Martiniozyma asiatica (nom. inval.)]|nr:hypothetical protein DAMA08_040180 [Martiniozyma asiatica]